MRSTSRPSRNDPACRTSRRWTDAAWFWPAVVFAAAFVLRSIYVLEVRFTPFFQTLGLDAKFYDQWARDILEGRAHAEAFFMTPLYSYFLAGVYWLFGRDLLLVRVVQAAIGSATALLTYGIGKAAFDRRVGIAAGLVTAAYGAFVFYDGAILIEPLLVLFVTLSLFLLLSAGASRRPWAFELAAGAALGMASIGRAAALVLVPVAAGWAWRERRAVAAAALVLAGLVAVVAPVTVRNYAVSRDFVAITSNGGINFYVGNSEVSTGGYVKPEGLDIIADPDGRTIAEAALGRRLKPSEVSSYWYGRAWRFISAQPGRWAALLVRKLHFATSSYEIPQLENFYFQKQYSKLLSLPLPGFAVIAPLGLVGLWLSLKRSRGRLLALYFAVYMLSIVTFFVVARYRLPAVPSLIAGACYAGFVFYDRVRERRWRELVWPAVSVAVLAVLVNANLERVDRGKAFAQSHFRLGIILSERGLVDEAIQECRRAIEIDPSYSKSYLNLGALLAEKGEDGPAIEAFRQALRLDPAYHAARLNLAMALERARDYDAALAQIDSLRAASPHDPAALKERGIVLYRRGDLDLAAEALREAARWDTGGQEQAEIAFYLGMIEGRTGQPLPVAARRAVAQADSLSKVGRVGEAVVLLERAAELAPKSGEPLRRLAFLKRDMGLGDEAVGIMRRALEIEPAMEHGHFGLGILLSDVMRHDEALREYEAESRVAPDFAPVHLNLALTYQFHSGNPNRAAYHYRRYLALGGTPVPSLDDLLRDLGAGL